VRAAPLEDAVLPAGELWEATVATPID